MRNQNSELFTQIKESFLTIVSLFKIRTLKSRIEGKYQ